MKHWAALLLAIVGGAIAAYTLTLLIGGALLGVLWLWVFGDDLWPRWAMNILEIGIPVVGLLLWPLLGRVFWVHLRRLHPDG